MPFISYAQNYEDVMLWRALRDVEKGFYVDVGAADPKVESVTCAFYERGWSGINIEPLDEYFDKLRQARPRDTNLKVAVGKETGVRTLHAFPGTGLSTFDAETGAKHQSAGLAGKEVVVPVLTLTKILEDCGTPPTIHFLKIDTEEWEAEVLEGLDLDRIRPWIIVIEATEPNSTISSRHKWEYLITGHRYGFAYFDGLNCFYVAEEVSKLKERLTAPPNFFDNFVRWQEWHLANYAADLEKQVQLENSENTNLRLVLETEKNALAAEQAQTANLRNALAAEQTQTANLHIALAAEQAQTTNLHNAWLARLDYLSSRVENVHAQLAFPWPDRAVGHVIEGLQQMGNRVTGGGIRAATMRLLKKFLRNYVAFAEQHPRLSSIPRTVLKPFPRFTSNLYRLAVPTLPSTNQSPQDDPLGSEDRPPLPEDPIAALPISARPIYLKLKVAVSREDVWRQDS